jgi:hypothetical protein
LVQSPSEIAKVKTELEASAADPTAPRPSLLRQLGAGRKRATDADPGFTAALERLVDPVTRGGPQSPLLNLQEHNATGARVDIAWSAVSLRTFRRLYARLLFGAHLTSVRIKDLHP